MAPESDVLVVGGTSVRPKEEVIDQMVVYLVQTGVLRAVLFGSYARGDQDEVSDLDLILIEETRRPFVERGLAHLPLFALGVGIDLLVYTPEEYARLLRDANRLIENIEREGVVIYARPGF